VSTVVLAVVALLAFAGVSPSPREVETLDAAAATFDDIAAGIGDTFDCADYDDAIIYTNTSCGYWDTKACDTFCSSDAMGDCYEVSQGFVWFCCWRRRPLIMLTRTPLFSSQLCGSSCAVGFGAPCAMGVLSNLSQICATQSEWHSDDSLANDDKYVETVGTEDCDRRAYQHRHALRSAHASDLPKSPSDM